MDKDVAALGEGVIGRDQGARTLGSLHDDAGTRHARYDPVSLGEPVALYLRAGRVFRDETPARIEDGCRQAPVRSRVDRLDAAGQDGERSALAPQRAAMGCRIYTPCQTRYDADTLRGQVGSQGEGCVQSPA